MLTLTLNNQPIPLPVDFSMQLTWKNPATNFDQIPSGYGLGLSIPVNEFTRPLFGYPERFAKYRDSTGSATGQKFPGCEIRFGGVLLMAGTLVITSGKKGNYEASLIDMVGVLGEKERERNILEIPEFGEEVEWANTNNFNPDIYPYCAFPISNPGFFKEKGVKVTRTNPPVEGETDQGTYDIEVLTFLFMNGLVNNSDFEGNVFTFDSIISLFDLVEETNSYSSSLGKVTVVSPFFFLNQIISKALQSSNFHIKKNHIDEDSSLRNVCIYNNFDITKTEVDTPGVWIDVKDEPKITYTESGEKIIEDTWKKKLVGGGTQIIGYYRTYTNSIIPKNHLPKMKVGELILSTQNLFNVIFHFLPNSTVNVYAREELIAGESFDMDQYFLGEWAIGEQKHVALKFTREHDDKDLLFSERWHDLSDRRTDIRAAVATMAALESMSAPEMGEIRFVTEQNSFFEYRFLTKEELDPKTLATQHIDILGWKEISIGLQDGWYEYGREEVEEIKSGWSSLYQGEFFATADQSGAMNMIKDREQSFSPRLLIRQIPAGMALNGGGTQTPEFSFEYDTPTIGLLPKFWKNWNPFWANRLEVSGDFDLPVNVLRHLVYNICQKYRTREGEFMIDEMSCEIFIDRIGVTEVKGFKV